MSHKAVADFVATINSIALKHDNTSATVDEMESILPFSRSTCESILCDLTTKSDDAVPSELEVKEADPIWSEEELDDIEQHLMTYSDPKSNSDPKLFQQQPPFHLDPTSPFQIVYVCGNEGKLKELQDFMGDSISKYFLFYDTDLDEIQSDEVAVVTDKVQRAKTQIEGILKDQNVKITKESALYVLVEDTSFYINRYSVNFNFPGPFCKFMVAANGCSGFIDMVKGHQDRRCTAEANYGMMRLGQNENEDEEENEVLLFRGECKGTIADEPRGDTTRFGWDAVFEYEGNKKTFAEMAVNEKNRVSHRADAMQKLKVFVQGLIHSASGKAEEGT